MRISVMLARNGIVLEGEFYRPRTGIFMATETSGVRLEAEDMWAPWPEIPQGTKQRMQMVW